MAGTWRRLRIEKRFPALRRNPLQRLAVVKVGGRNVVAWGFKTKEFLMRKSLSAVSIAAIFAGTVALSVPASAQDDSIIVNAPRFHGDEMRLN